MPRLTAFPAFHDFFLSSFAKIGTAAIIPRKSTSGRSLFFPRHHDQFFFLGLYLCCLRAGLRLASGGLALRFVLRLIVVLVAISSSFLRLLVRHSPNYGVNCFPKSDGQVIENQAEPHDEAQENSLRGLFRLWHSRKLPTSLFRRGSSPWWCASLCHCPYGATP